MRRQTSLPVINADPINPNPTSARGFTTELSPRPKPYSSAAPTRAVNQGARSNFYTSTFQVSNVSVVVFNENEARAYLAIQNNSASDMYVAFGGPASVNGTNSFKLPAGGVWTFEGLVVPNNSMSAISATGGQLAITEGVYK